LQFLDLIKDEEVNMAQDSYNNSASPDQAEANEPSKDEQNAGISLKRLKDYGEQGLSPFIELLHKYQGNLDPYLTAISKGLQGAQSALSTEQATPQEKTVHHWFEQASQWFSDFQNNLSVKSPREVLHYVEDQARKNPGLMFSVSYVGGLFMGRLGRQIGKKIKQSKTSSTNLQ
jgi:hypothetical protein